MSVSRRTGGQKGFTIVELLIVIVVIAILAAVSIIAYNGIQGRANDSTVASDIQSAVKQIELQAVDTDGKYTVPTSATPIKLTKSSYWTENGNVFYCVNSVTNVYILAARSKSGRQYKYISNEGLTEHSSAIYRQPACTLVDAGTYNSSNSPMAGYAIDTGWADWIRN